jgi:hypothetical protein
VEDNTHAGQGPVVLDIGGDVGALIVSMPSAMEGIEVEVCPAGTRPAGHVPHVAVVGRPTSNGVHYAVVFPELPQGNYDLNQRHQQQVALTVNVAGARVTTAAWPD